MNSISSMDRAHLRGVILRSHFFLSRSFIFSCNSSANVFQITTLHHFNYFMRSSHPTKAHSVSRDFSGRRRWPFVFREVCPTFLNRQFRPVLAEDSCCPLRVLSALPLGAAVAKCKPRQLAVWAQNRPKW